MQACPTNKDQGPESRSGGVVLQGQEEEVSGTAERVVTMLYTDGVCLRRWSKGKVKEKVRMDLHSTLTTASHIAMQRDTLD